MTRLLGWPVLQGPSPALVSDFQELAAVLPSFLAPPAASASREPRARPELPSVPRARRSVIWVFLFPVAFPRCLQVSAVRLHLQMKDQMDQSYPAQCDRREPRVLPRGVSSVPPGPRAGPWLPVGLGWRPMLAVCWWSRPHSHSGGLWASHAGAWLHARSRAAARWSTAPSSFGFAARCPGLTGLS